MRVCDRCGKPATRLLGLEDACGDCYAKERAKPVPPIVRDIPAGHWAARDAASKVPPRIKQLRNKQTHWRAALTLVIIAFMVTGVIYDNRDTGGPDYPDCSTFNDRPLADVEYRSCVNDYGSVVTYRDYLKDQ